MSKKEMLKKIVVDQAQLAADVRNNQLATQNLEKQFKHGLQLEELAPKKRNTEAVMKESEPKDGEVVAQEERVQPIVKPPPPFPQKFKKQKEDECFGKFLSLLKQVHINLPLVDVLQGIPRYAKYVKEIMVNKRRLTEYETIELTEECSSRIQNKLPTKLKDLGSFTVQITIEQSIHARGFLADRSIARSEGIVEDVLVQVGSLIFLVDFVVLNFELDPEVPFILGRPFLATGRAIIDVAAGQLTMQALDKVEVFDMYKALMLPAVYEELSTMTVIDLEAEAHYIASKDPLERVLVGDDIYGDAEAQEMVQYLDVALVGTSRDRWKPLNKLLGLPPKPSIKEAPQLELKAFPAHFMYAFLGEDKTLPVILSATLS
ncbi:uncharacterized protein LOC125833085 [Solanum verrucosum]|uniref:uncharacterized protein LOC125833085 n=1 Tax=Solanum verrucosum TaxID=315347 RepID=UPI0020D11DF2|nr:uncharacterized protein LOC125833085 [Solanum verrucosum]